MWDAIIVTGRHSLLSFEIFEDLQHTYSWMKYYNTELEVGKNDEGVLKDLLTDVVKSICQSLKKLRETKDSYSAQIKAIDSGIPNNHIREHCLANLAQINMNRFV